MAGVSEIVCGVDDVQLLLCGDGGANSPCGSPPAGISSIHEMRFVGCRLSAFQGWIVGNRVQSGLPA